MADYIPAGDLDYEKWLVNLSTYVASNTAAVGLTPADATALTTARNQFQTALNQYGNAQNAAAAARQTKDGNRVSSEALVRPMVRRIQAYPGTTDAMRESMQITVKDTTPTVSSQGSNGGTRPVGVVDTSQRLRHEIRFFDETTPTSRAKPAEAIGCEIWVKIGEAPGSIQECQFVAMDSATPYVTEYPASEGGKMANYLLRWIYKNGEKGPVSETVSATIVA